ncbi:MAG: extracellular solute-binding protein [Vallitaleaceae bacterium]|nr:extracellular solute-binding protein [Vallitaleaceae bacterium]
MKKLLTLALTLILLLSVSACTKSEKESTDENGSGAQQVSQEPQALVIAARGGSHVDAMNAVKEAFESENNVTIEILGLEGDDLKQKISLDSTNQTASYDLIMADDPWMPELCEAGIFANLEDLGIVADDDFISTSLDLGKHPYATGTLYALPFSGNVQLFFYNKEIFQSAGLDVPTNWADVLTSAQTIKSSGKVGYVIRGQQGNPIVSDFLPIFWAYGGKLFDDQWNATFNNEQGKEALQLYLDLFATGANYEKADLVSSVSEGSAGMSLGWPSWYISGTDSTAEYAQIPTKIDSSSSSQSTGMIGNWMMGITANSSKKELAAKFLSFITSSNTQKEMVTSGGVPTRKSVYLDSELSTQYPHFATMLEAHENSVARPRTAKWSEAEAILGAELSAVVSGTKSIDEALAEAEKQINELMQN